MYSRQPKKMLIMNILDILKKYSDADHRLSQKEIVDILFKEYEMPVDRKSVKRNLVNLIDYGYPIEYSESVRKSKDGNDELIYSDWYINREFSNAELRLLIDSLLFSKNISHNQCKELIEKLKGLSNSYFKSNAVHIYNLPDNIPANKQLLYTIEVLNEAIENGKQVSFLYNCYDIDKKMHPRTNDEGKIRRYIINPYQIVSTHGRYYLLCNYDKYDSLSNYRLDRITDIKLLDTPCKSGKCIEELKGGLNLPKHMAEHIYMFSGDSARVTFRAKRYIVTEIIDWFGDGINFFDATSEDVTVSVMVNLEAMYMWAMQYSEHIKILYPSSLADRVKNTLSDALKKYSE